VQQLLMPLVAKFLRAADYDAASMSIISSPTAAQCRKRIREHYDKPPA